MELIKKERFILLIYAVTLLTISAILLLYGKTEIHMYINRHSHPIFDYLFKYITLLGDGILVLFVCCILLFYQYKISVTQAIAYALSGTITQIFKHLIFSDSPRPILYFKNHPEYILRLVEGVEPACHNSFPSGHTASAFAMFMLFAFMVKNRPLKIFLLLAALLVGYSRVYLSQHFLADITFGSLIGVASAILSSKITQQINIDGSILKTARKIKSDNYA